MKFLSVENERRSKVKLIELSGSTIESQQNPDDPDESSVVVLQGLNVSTIFTIRRNSKKNVDDHLSPEFYTTQFISTLGNVIAHSTNEDLIDVIVDEKSRQIKIDPLYERGEYMNVMPHLDVIL